MEGDKGLTLGKGETKHEREGERGRGDSILYRSQFVLVAVGLEALVMFSI